MKLYRVTITIYDHAGPIRNKITTVADSSNEAINKVLTGMHTKPSNFRVSAREVIEK